MKNHDSGFRLLSSNKFWIAIFGITVFICIVTIVLTRLLTDAEDAAKAYIHSRGELIEVIDLYNLQEPRFIEIRHGGMVNVIEAMQGRVRVAQSNCKGNDCVRQGWLSGGVAPVVCLPHELVIRVETYKNDVDGVAG